MFSKPSQLPSSSVRTGNRLSTAVYLSLLSLAGFTAHGAMAQESALKPEQQRISDAAVRALLLETSTLGVRWHDATRQILPRQPHAGALRTKAAERPDGHRTVKVESDDLAGIATLAARRAAARREEGQ